MKMTKKMMIQSVSEMMWAFVEFDSELADVDLSRNSWEQTQDENRSVWIFYLAIIKVFRFFMLNRKRISYYDLPAIVQMIKLENLTRRQNVRLELSVDKTELDSMFQFPSKNNYISFVVITKY